MKLPIYVTLAITLAVTLCHGQGTLITGHFGAADPTTEGFTLLRSGNPSLAPVTDDFGLNAWSIGLDTDADIGRYSRLLSSQEQAALAAGWTLSLTLRVLEPFGLPTVGVFASLQTGTQSFPLVFLGAQPDGDPILRVGNAQYTLEGAGAGYHNYQLTYDAQIGSAGLWVDGALLATGITGSPNPTAQFSWGGGQHPGSAYANWNEVSLWAIPEPSALALLTLGGGGWLAVRGWRRNGCAVKRPVPKTG
jgi:hypothetical protein